MGIGKGPGNNHQQLSVTSKMADQKHVSNSSENYKQKYSLLDIIKNVPMFSMHQFIFDLCIFFYILNVILKTNDKKKTKLTFFKIIL